MFCKINIPVRKEVSKVNNENSSKKAENLFKANDEDNRTKSVEFVPVPVLVTSNAFNTLN